MGHAVVFGSSDLCLKPQGTGLGTFNCTGQERTWAIGCGACRACSGGVVWDQLLLLESIILCRDCSIPIDGESRVGVVQVHKNKI